MFRRIVSDGRLASRDINDGGFWKVVCWNGHRDCGRLCTFWKIDPTVSRNSPNVRLTLAASSPKMTPAPALRSKAKSCHIFDRAGIKGVPVVQSSSAAAPSAKHRGRKERRERVWLLPLSHTLFDSSCRSCSETHAGTCSWNNLSVVQRKNSRATFELFTLVSHFRLNALLILK